jgi:TonB family protein
MPELRRQPRPHEQNAFDEMPRQPGTPPRKTARFLPTPRSQRSDEPQQRRMMVIALALLLIALAFILYKDRDFWFPDTQEAQEQNLQQNIPATLQPQQASPTTKTEPALAKKSRSSKKKSRSKAQPAVEAQPEVAVQPDPPAAGATITQRTVLPPLEVEVVAGDAHQTLRPGSDSVHVELQAEAPPQPAPAEPVADTDASTQTSTPTTVTTNAAERVQMSDDTASIVTHSVKPDYPLLARQMKVQGSVVLQALIGRDGTIQDLHILGGPPILATAAEEAVRQWHFKPHYEGPDTVETQATITVNFTISTN